MATSLTVNGIVYQYPDDDDLNWGAQATAWATAVSNATLQKNGGAFTLTAEANFGPDYGLKAKYLKSTVGTASTVGTVRLSNTDSIAWRNGADSADLTLTINADKLRFNSDEVLTTASLGSTLGAIICDSIAINGGTTLTTSNQTGTGSIVLATSPTLTTATLTSPTINSATMTTPSLGVATATSVNKVSLTAPATGATLTLADGSTLATVGAFTTTLTASGNTSLTLPTTGTLSTLAGTETLTNKTLGNFTQDYQAENKSPLIQYYDFHSQADIYISGMVPATSVTLTSDISAGVAYVQQMRVVMPLTSKTWTASKDTYLDVKYDSTYTYSEVANGAGAPAVPAGHMRVAKVVTNGTAVTTVTMLKNANLTTFGRQGSGGKVTTGVDNVIFGHNAGIEITTGAENTIVGAYAGPSLTTGSDNVFIGTYSGYLNQDGYENINIGLLAGRNIVSGFTNVNIGSNAGRSTSSGNGNTCIGNRAGYTLTPANALTTGTNNVYIGQNAGGASSSQFDNSIAIGNEAVVNASNTWVVGKLGTKQAIKEGSNAAMGVSTLVGGTVVVSNTKVTANSRIFLSTNTAGGTVGHPYVSARSAGVSFTITSTSGTDTSTIAWEIKEPA